MSRQALRPDQRLQPVDAVDDDRLEVVFLGVEARERLDHLLEGASQRKVRRRESAESILRLHEHRLVGTATAKVVLPTPATPWIRMRGGLGALRARELCEGDGHLALLAIHAVVGGRGDSARLQLFQLVRGLTDLERAGGLEELPHAGGHALYFVSETLISSERSPPGSRPTCAVPPPLP